MNFLETDEVSKSLNDFVKYCPIIKKSIYNIKTENSNP